MLIKKTEFKIEVILLLCFVFLFIQALPVAEVKKQEKAESQGQRPVSGKLDEPTSGNMLVVEYATGSEDLLHKETGKVPVTTPTGVPTATISPVPAGGQGLEAYASVADLIEKKYVLENLLNLSYLKDNFYIVNASTKMTEEEFDVEYFMEKDLTLKKTSEPQILIFHTHGSEGFIDSRTGEQEDTVAGVGALLAEILREKYGYQVIHDTTLFDRKNGKDNRNSAYNDALDFLEDFLEEYPSVEVVIDLHRDAGAKRVMTLNGKQTAKVMLFNGLSRNTKGKLTYLPNINLKENLAFSFQMKVTGDELYPGLMNRIFLKDYRYNMHMKEHYLLIELGTEQNTVEEARNAMEPLADILALVLGE